MKYDAIVLAGDRGTSHNIYGENKAFLKLDGIPLIGYVLASLEEANSIDKIYVVGPKYRLEKEIEKVADYINDKKGLEICEQRNNLYENSWYGFLNTLPDYKEGVPLTNSAYKEYKDKAVLFIPADIPLVTAAEIEYFLSRCDIGKHDYFSGLTPEKSIRYFYPTKKTPGIKMACFNLKEDKCRINNLHLVKPIMIGNREYIQKMYDYRYQKNFRNIIKLIMEFVKTDTMFKSLWYFGLMHSALILSTIHLDMIAYINRRFLPLSSVERCISEILKTRFTTVETPFGGTALDIDKEEDYDAMKVMFLMWREYQNEMVSKYNP